MYYYLLIITHMQFISPGLQKLTLRTDSNSDASLHSPLPNGDVNGPLSPTPQLKTPTFSVSVKEQIFLMKLIPFSLFLLSI
jgi:hypothetical protein